MMTWLKTFIKIRVLPLVFALAAASLLLFPIFPVDQNNSFSRVLLPDANASTIGFINIIRRIIGRDDSRDTQGLPSGKTASGGGRGPVCTLADNQVLNTVNGLVFIQEGPKPRLGGKVKVVGGLTTKEHPTLLFYLPHYVIDTENSKDFQKLIAQFVLLDNETKSPVWNELMAIELAGAPQLVEYPLEDYSLDTNRLYSWYFSLICDVDKLSRNSVIRGWIRRVEPTPQLQMDLRAVDTPQHHAYAVNDIWFDAASALAELRRNFSDVSSSDWLDLMEYSLIDMDEASDSERLAVQEIAAELEPKLINRNQREVVGNDNQLPVSM